jgi:hypothetical protein
MWRIDNPKFEPTTLDFTSSGQSHFQATRLVSDGVELMNAIELMDWDDDKIQVSICGHCGTVGCSSGGWIVFRSAGDFLLLMPAFDAMSDDNWSKTEFSPPYFVQDKGTAYFDRRTYESLREQFSSFPPLEKIQPLQMREAMWLVQSSAPLQILGEPATLDIDRRKFDFVIAAMEGDPKEHLRQAESLLRENFENKSVARLRPFLPDEESVWLFLDAAEFIDWQAMVSSHEKYKFVLDNEFVVDNGDS